jgi:hypothetical protein
MKIHSVIDNLHILLICDWLVMQELCKLDIAVSDHGARKPWLHMDRG